ncbi:hypothetical protein [Actinocorallia populi]|uniref:hypothetical protein n=1 Tax=Actinocorallia populi TaxID=2079200 RepID=UPI0018E5A3AF|nr:hypothetical protein [Actinocorallia populi]
MAEPVRSRADLLAERLKKRPVQVGDHELRVVPEGAAERIEQTLGALGVPFFVVVETAGLYRVEREEPGELIPLLRDRLRKKGVYLVTDPSGDGTARQYGGALPVEQAWHTARMEMPYDADVTEYVARFVEILKAPDVNARIEARRQAPKPEYQVRAEARDRAEMKAFTIGAAVGGLPLLVLLAFRFVRKGARK